MRQLGPALSPLFMAFSFPYSKEIYSPCELSWVLYNSFQWQPPPSAPSPSNGSTDANQPKPGRRYPSCIMMVNSCLSKRNSSFPCQPAEQERDCRHACHKNRWHLLGSVKQAHCQINVNPCLSPATKSKRPSTQKKGLIWIKLVGLKRFPLGLMYLGFVEEGSVTIWAMDDIGVS